ncbi:MAG: hypothetical protein JO290_11220 [Sphingomonadaceae bacterium]|nr:hypothetical protein [Sphingomonadaceae bacterium]MBV9098014.1 hypothetical protein [Frankiaceae bacterium]
MSDDPEITVTARDVGPDDVTLKIAGNAYAGWTDIAITLRAEALPNSFSIAVTARDPKNGSASVTAPGDACEVTIGNNRVITGYVDRVIEGGSATEHRLEVVGRGKCADLVDCSAEWPGGQIKGANALEVARKLAEPYGIDVTLADGIDPGPAVPQINLNYGETAYSIIERVTRAAALLAYEDRMGRLVLAQAGTVTAASGFAYGQNVQAWQVTNASDERFSDIVCSKNGVDLLGDLGEGGNFFATQHDPNVKRHRLIYLVAEPALDPYGFVEMRAKWELARRAGRGRVARVTVDSWRDSAGTLWEPNTLAPIDVPGLAAGDKTLVIAEVTYRRDNGSGTTAELILMPKEAFLPEPISLQTTSLADITPS